MAGINDTAVKQDETYFYYIHDDQLGSSHVLTQGKQDGSVHSGITYGEGDLLQRIEYTPFGTEKFVLNPNLKFDPRYTGQEYDIETGLYYYKARYYDPKLSRFIQPDTIVPSAKNLQAYNRYSYVVNNPLKFTDPSGHSFGSWFKKLIGPFLGAILAVVLGFALTATLGPLGAAVVAGFAGGFLSGAITGAISGGWRGALLGGLIGGAIGALSGLAFGGLNIGLEKGLNIVDKWARIGIMSGIGAGLSYATGGWKGLAMFGAGLAGAAVGMAATGQFGAGAKGMSPQEKAKFKFNDLENFKFDTSIPSDSPSAGLAGNDVSTGNTASDVLSSSQITTGQAIQQQRAPSSLSQIMNAGKGYLDINISFAPTPVPLGATGGVIIDASLNFYLYVGGGVMTPGFSYSKTGAWSDVTTGQNNALQSCFGVCGQLGEAGKVPYLEIGSGSPGASLSRFYIFDI